MLQVAKRKYIYGEKTILEIVHRFFATFLWEVDLGKDLWARVFVWIAMKYVTEPTEG